VTVRPLFLLSLPRSGSTLVQRVLASRPEISTTPEPWLLLPLLYARRERGTFSEYGEVPAARAISEFVQRLPGAEEDFRRELHDFVVCLYGLASHDGTTYFLDKTPRYHFVVDDLFELFPDGKFVFLWRNPLSIVSSIVETWAGGRWSLGRWREDLFGGLARLVDSAERHPEAFATRFETLLTETPGSWAGLLEYLDLPAGSVDLDVVPPGQRGRMGDQVGVRRYAGMSTEPLDKWKTTLAHPLRVRWAKHYLMWVGEHRLGVMGYDLDSLLRSLDALPRTHATTVSDAVRLTYGSVTSRRRTIALRRLTKRGKW
jgi:hypothetical protein